MTCPVGVRGRAAAPNQYQAFDPWGERANVANATPYRQNDADPFRRSAQDYDRGYAGHEQLDDSGLIHMNGRIYDPELGRMLSPDPYVQVPEYSQNFNRYSYVLNNPLNKTDPTGYSWLSKAFHKIGSWLKENWRTVVAIVFVAILTFVFMPGLAFMGFNSLGLMAGYSGAQIGATIGAISGAFNSAINGGNFSDILKGAVIGGVAGYITGGTLHGYEETAASAVGIDKAVAIGKHVVGHGVVGGASNEAMGGKFQDGFLSGAASAAAVHAGLTSKYSKYGSAIGAAGRTAAAAIIGGTASALGGGKFANGAYTAGFQHLLNAEMWSAPKRLLIVGPDWEGLERTVKFWQNEGFFDVTTVNVKSDIEFANALINNGKYDELVYLGHGVPGALATASGRGGNIITDGKTTWIGTKASSLDFSNLRKDPMKSPQIILCTCNSAVSHKTAGKSIASSFANASGVKVIGSGAGVGFHADGRPFIRNVHILSNILNEDVWGSGGWQTISPK